MKQDLLKELAEKYKAENRSSKELYASIKTTGMQMFVTNTMSKEQVLTFCSSLLKLFENLTVKQTEVKND
jgi:DNA phosphorothioation-dependent restriction protein DptG